MPPVAAQQATAIASGQVPAAFTSGELTITAPTSGTVVQAGETIPVVVAPAADLAVNSVLFVGPDVALVDEVAPFEFNLEIPSDVLGTFEVTAFGAGENILVEANVVSLQVTTTAAITSMTLLQHEFFLLGVGDTRQIYAFGEYSDGESREISGNFAGTTYLTADAAIATVSADGVISAVSAGETTITVRNGSFEEMVEVAISMGNFASNANAATDQTVKVGSAVVLDGRQSYDLNDAYDTLLFEWTQTSGPTSTLAGGATDSPSFTPSQAGDYTFGLTVRDGNGTSASDSVVIGVEAEPVTNPDPDPNPNLDPDPDPADTSSYLYLPIMMNQ
jgi:hypothetical protein